MKISKNKANKQKYRNNPMLYVNTSALKRGFNSLKLDSETSVPVREVQRSRQKLPLRAQFKVERVLWDSQKVLCTIFKILLNCIECGLVVNLDKMQALIQIIFFE